MSRAGVPNPFLFDYTPGDSVAAKAGSFSRTSPATYFDRQGLLQTAPPGVLRDAHYIGAVRTALLEVSRANALLFCRDFTNAAWTPTSITAALDQVGVDGIAASASSLLATAGNATVLQAIAGGGATRISSAFVKRLTGSGAIQMTQDGGSTWTTVTVTAAWTRVSIPAAVMGTQSVGFRIVTSGDKIAVDYIQNEAGGFISSPILTLSGAATRAAESLTFPYATAPQAMSFYAAFVNLSAGFNGAYAVAFIGASGGSVTRLTICDASGPFAVVHGEAGGPVTGTSGGPTPALGDWVELNGQLNANGSVQAQRRINGGDMRTGTTTSTLAIGGSWTANVLQLDGSSLDGSAACFAFTSLRVMAGVQDITVMSAPVGLAAEVAAYAHLLELDFSGGPIYLTTAPLNITATVGYPDGSSAGHTFSAIGGEASIEEIAEGIEIGSQQATLKLSAVDQTVIAAVLTNACVGLKAYIWRCYVAADGTVAAVPLLFAGYLNDDWVCDDHRPEDPRQAATATIETRIVDIFSDFDQVRGIQTSLASHQSVPEQAAVAAGATSEHLFINDLGMRYVAVMPWKRFQWGPLLFTVEPTLPYQQRGGGATAGQRH